MINKNEINKIDKNYTKVTLDIFSIGLSLEAIGLYSYFSSCKEDFNPSVKFISEKFDISRNTCYKYINELKSRNIISEVKEGTQYNATIYKFNPLEEWIRN